MSDLISRSELFNKLATVQTLGEAYGIIQGMPTVDAVPVQRCGGCRYADWHSNGCIAYCTKHGTDGHVDDGFCSEGEKDGDSNDLRNLEPHPK